MNMHPNRQYRVFRIVNTVLLGRQALRIAMLLTAWCCAAWSFDLDGSMPFPPPLITVPLAVFWFAVAWFSNDSEVNA